ncbi:MAG: hypothetical protein ACOX6I_05185 [Syntrophomonadaceae bacterium]|jgi:hypothetical protein
MAVALTTMAGVILLVYSLYFTRIIKGNPQMFELELLKALADWMISKGPASRNHIRIMLLLSVLLEGAYFLLAIFLVSNIVMQFFTGMLAGVEIIHLLTMAINFSRFFRGKIVLKNIFNWHLERISALLLFTHALLVLVVLICF